jgi:hypothetical protein
MKLKKHRQELNVIDKMFEKNVPGVIATLIVWAFIHFSFQYHFFLKEQIALFAFDSHHITSYFGKPAFFARFLGDFFSQFFYLRGMAAIIVSVSFLLIFLLTKKVIQIFSGKPLSGFYAVFPPVFVVLLIFNVNSDLSFLMSCLLALLLSWGYFLLPLKWWRPILPIMLYPALYVALGGVVILIGLLILLYEWKPLSDDKITGFQLNKERNILSFLGVIFSAVVPLLFRQHYTVSVCQAYLFPFQHELVSLVWIIVPFISLILSVLLSTLNKTFENRALQLSIALVFIAIISLDFHSNVNLRLEKLLALDSEWYFGNIDKMYKFAECYDYKSSVGAYYSNLAHSERGELAEKFFDVNQTGPKGLILPVRNKGSYLPIIFSNEVYFHIGDVNASQHSALLGMIFAPNNYSSRLLRRLVQINIINGEYKVAEKYLRILETTLFHKKWAKRLLEVLDDESRISQISWVKEKRPLVPSNENLRRPNDHIKALKLLLEKNSKNQKALHYKLCYHLLSKEVEKFANTFFENKDVLLRRRIPRIYQEALVIYHVNNPDLEIWSEIPVEPATIRKFADYNEQFERYKGEGSKLKAKFEETYWFYYHYADAEED